MALAPSKDKDACHATKLRVEVTWAVIKISLCWTRLQLPPAPILFTPENKSKTWRPHLATYTIHTNESEPCSIQDGPFMDYNSQLHKCSARLGTVECWVWQVVCLCVCPSPWCADVIGKWLCACAVTAHLTPPVFSCSNVLICYTLKYKTPLQQVECILLSHKHNICKYYYFFL